MLIPHVGQQGCTFEIVGQFNGETAVELIALVRQALLERGEREIELDLSGVQEIDAAGVWGLMEAKSVGGGAVRVTGHSRAVMARLGAVAVGSAVQAANDSPIVP
jgi:ABC-type transporter Mla MlaB component